MTWSATSAAGIGNTTADSPELLRYAPDREPVALIIVVLRVEVVGVEVEVVSVTSRVGSR